MTQSKKLEKIKLIGNIGHKNIKNFKNLLKKEIKLNQVLAIIIL
jgi:hypothetical protein